MNWWNISPNLLYMVSCCDDVHDVGVPFSTFKTFLSRLFRIAEASALEFYKIGINYFLLYNVSGIFFVM